MKRLPLIVEGMSHAESEEFQNWLFECCGMNFDTATEKELHDAAALWYDEQYDAENYPGPDSSN